MNRGSPKNKFHQWMYVPFVGGVMRYNNLHFALANDSNATDEGEGSVFLLHNFFINLFFKVLNTLHNPYEYILSSYASTELMLLKL